MKRFLKLLLISIYLLMPVTLWAADIQVRIDRSQIEVNESFTLIFESNEAVDDEPDFSPLEKDFQVINKSTSSNISIINGQYMRNQRWSVNLMALREGTFTIPSISFGSDQSPEYKITIQPVKASSTGALDDFISELTISHDSTYPQAQIIVTQRLLSSKNITAYEFSKLKTSGVDVVIESLGDIKQYQTQRGNSPYLILEQHYALFPQSSGTLVIEPSIASARLALNSSRSPYDPFRSNTKTVRRASQPGKIEVKSIPGEFRGEHWLVANEVQLVEEFPDATEFKVGEPLTRTISLLADGQSMSQLPDIPLSEIAGIKQYPDQPLTNNNITDTGITGISQVKVALIPSRPGDYNLPEISIPWWNRKTDKMEIARIAERTIHVVADKTAATSVTTKPTANLQSITNESTPAPASPSEDSNTHDYISENHSVYEASSKSTLTWKIIALLLLLAWLYTLYLLWKARKAAQADSTQEKQYRPADLKSSYQQLKLACDNHDAQGCKLALLYWANAVFSDKQVFSLGELASQVDATGINTQLAESIRYLNSCLYSNPQVDWKCDKLTEQCQTFSQQYQTTESTETEALETLYK